ncbi:phosphotransferase [uncultured Roseobacter sp.]|uniref:aminoglycoside phosphotransferase family protein n=1 Tax=uncultured Roseobacter sp. TaxID=114847 RepID=UPI0026335C6A|nr:phosphotransferase [uncultured Roseobacter sp.]
MGGKNESLGSVTSRDRDLEAFVERAGWGGATITPLAGDASTRRYDRLVQPDGMRAVLMDAPPAKGNDIRPFTCIAAYLAGIGLSAPRIFAQDDRRGFLLLEDLGDDLFARVLEREPQREAALYEAAVDVLVHLHRAPPPPLATYDAATLTSLTAPAFDWYQFGIAGEINDDARTEFSKLFEKHLAPLDTQPKVLIQRDYHAENLLWLPERHGLARVGVLDFQDAVLGHTAYDLVSLLQDARRDVPPELERQMIDHFLDQSPHDRERFTTAYAVLGAQRNLRILGVFSWLCLRDGKAHYIDLIPRVWGHVQTNLKHPALADLVKHIRQSLPPPTPDALTLLRSKCATFPDR